MLISLLISIALTNKIINKVTGAFASVSIGTIVIFIWNHVSKIQHRDLLPPYTAEHHHAQVLVRMIISSGLYWIRQLEATLLNVSTLFILLYQFNHLLFSTIALTLKKNALTFTLRYIFFFTRHKMLFVSEKRKFHMKHYRKYFSLSSNVFLKFFLFWYTKNSG